jgi:Calx-beta domain
VGILGFAQLPVKDRVSFPPVIGCSGYASATGFELKTTLMGHPGAGSAKFSALNYIVDDNVGTATVSVVRGGGDTLPLIMEYATSNKTAQAGSDYAAVSGTLNFGPGVTSQAFTIPITSGCASN